MIRSVASQPSAHRGHGKLSVNGNSAISAALPVRTMTTPSEFGRDVAVCAVPQVLKVLPTLLGMVAHLALARFSASIKYCPGRIVVLAGIVIIKVSPPP